MLREMERAKLLKKLFDRFYELETDESLPHADRQQCACKHMDECVGEEWRDEIKLGGVDLLVLEVPDVKPVVENFYSKVKSTLRDKGIADAPKLDDDSGYEPLQTATNKKRKQSIIKRLKDVLR